jgi:hypothetical protein
MVINWIFAMSAGVQIDVNEFFKIMSIGLIFPVYQQSI